MKDKWRNYALKTGKIKENHLRKYKNRNGAWKAAKTSYSDSVQCSGKEQEKEEVVIVYREPTEYEKFMHPELEDALKEKFVIDLRKKDENSREEKPVEAYQQGQQRVQTTTQGRPRVEKEDNCQTKGKEMKKEKESPKAHKKHESKESKAYERKEDKKEAKKEKGKK